MYITIWKLKNKGLQMREYLETLLEEKGIQLDTPIEVMGASGINLMSVGVVVEHIAIAPKHEQKKIRDILVQIDFKNGDILHFFKHLAQALAV